MVESMQLVDEEAALDPQRPIVDPHHHLWDHPGLQPFLLPEMLETIARSGHKITHTVFAECLTMYRADGPEEMRSIGETEFVNGISAMSASGRYGACRVATAIIGNADLRLGDGVKRLLEAQIAAGNGRLRGIRTRTAYADSGLHGQPPDPAIKGLMMDSRFRKGVSQLEPLGLSLDVWCVHPQLGELCDLTAAFPRTSIILDHIGSPLSIGTDTEKGKGVFAEWRKGIVEVARRPNVTIKLGGLGMDLFGPIGAHPPSANSPMLAEKWRPYMETCIAAFGPERCMFESNFPVDSAACSYGVLWNAFKLIAAGYSETDKTRLFSDSAKRVYRLN